MDQPMTEEESYADRRKLFKDIWDTAFDINHKNGDIITKPKVIKTLRLDEVDHSAGKRKKQKIKNLRTVCNRLLEFCDRQEATDLRNKQILIENKDSEESNLTGGTKRKAKSNPKKYFRNNQNCIPINSTAENITQLQYQTTSQTVYMSRDTLSTKTKDKTLKYMNKMNAIPLRKKPTNDLTQKDLNIAPDKGFKVTNVRGKKCSRAKENALWLKLGKNV